MIQRGAWGRFLRQGWRRWRRFLRRLGPKGGYDRWAATYDEGNPLLPVESMVLSRLLPAMEGQVVGDIAVGTGRHLPDLLARGVAAIIAVDQSEAMMERAVKRQLSHVRVVKGEMTALPLTSGALQGAICYLALAHVEGIAEAFAEMSRVLVPGGWLVVTDLHPEVLMKGGQVTFTQEGRTWEIRSWPRSEEDLVRYAREADLHPDRREEGDVKGVGKAVWGMRFRRGK